MNGGKALGFYRSIQSHARSQTPLNDYLDSVDVCIFAWTPSALSQLGRFESFFLQPFFQKTKYIGLPIEGIHFEYPH